MSDKINFSDWDKIEIKTGKILEIEDIEGADKLYKLTIDIGEKKPRTLAAGIKEHYSKDQLKGKSCLVLANLEPKKLRGIESNGMILAATQGDKVVLVSPESDIEPGSQVS